MRLVWGLALTCISFASHANEFRVRGYALDLPPAFEGPKVQSEGASRTAYVFSAPGAKTGTPVTLQITTLEQKLPSGANPARLAEVAKRFLVQILAGIERRRVAFRRGPPTSIELAGAPGASIAWTGLYSDLKTNGIMFCVVDENGAVFFHVTGGGYLPDAHMESAIHAIEQLRRARH